MAPHTEFPEEILRYYSAGNEAGRLDRSIGPLERARSQELMLRYLPQPPAVIYDVGGGPGAYSFWLAGLGYSVHLIDITPIHVEQAREAAARSTTPHPVAMEVGDARCLDRPDASADAVILHGPLYHLTERASRLAALSEARRVLRPGGLLLAFAIGHFASTIVGLLRGWVFDPDYLAMIRSEIETGQHSPPKSWPWLLTTAYFHSPEELRAELAAAGMRCDAVLGVQGPGWHVPDFEANWQDEGRRSAIIEVARLAEHAPILSPHMLAVGRKP